MIFNTQIFIKEVKTHADLTPQGAVQKVWHSPEGRGGLKNCHFEMANEPFVTLLGGRGHEMSIFRSDIVFAWPLRKGSLNFSRLIFLSLTIHH